MGCACSIAAEDACVHEHYSFHEKLGQGAFGQVRACAQRGTKLSCAVKIIKVDGHRTEKKGAQKEGLLWERVGCHQHVVSLLASYADEHFSYFVMERCEHSLCDMLLQEADIVSTFRQMLLGIQACHSVGVVHRDVKPANFLVSMNGSVKLCDFGLATVEKDGGCIGIAGSSPFMSPEMVQWKAYDSKTDIWSLGATAYLMLYGSFPYVITQTDDHMMLYGRNRSRNQTMQRAIATDSPPIAYTTEDGLQCPSAIVRDFVQTLLQRDTNKRPSSNECLCLPAMQLKDSSRIEIPSREASPSSKIQRDKRRTAEFKTPMDPTVEKTMDDLIEQLQTKFQGSFARSFSLPVPGEKQPVISSRSNSHGGELSTRLGDETSECSTTASSGSKAPQIYWV